jgi:signal transduction histidine kinase
MSKLPTVKTLEAQTQSHNFTDIHPKIFRAGILTGTVGPIAVILFPYLFGFRFSNGLLYCSLFCCISSILIYGWFLKYGNINRCSSFLSLIILIDYAFALASSGGLHSPVLAIYPCALVICAFLIHFRGTMAATIYSVLLIILLYELEQVGFISHPDVHAPSWVLLVEFAWTVAVVGGLTSLLQFLKEKSDDSLVSELRTSEYQKHLLVENEKKLQEAQSISKVGSWDLSLTNNNLTWSSEHYKIFEVTEPQSPELLMVLYRSRIHSEDIPELDRMIGRAIRFGEDFIYNHRFVSNDGKRIKYLQGIGRVIKDTNGVPISVGGTCQDRTRDAELENELQQERLKAAHNSKLASLGEMAAGMAHEINNPLAIIAGNIPMLRKFKNDPDKLEAKYEAITKSTERISKIVKSLSKFSRSSGERVLKLESMANIINEAIIITEAKAKRHTTSIEFKLKSPCHIMCDAVEIEQVVINLINNGIDAIKVCAEKWIRVNVFENGDEVVLQVVDSGLGISEDIEEKLFQPFFTTKIVGQGTGLGLSIAKGILDEHKATIKLNRSFENTCFEIRIPSCSEVKGAI